MKKLCCKCFGGSSKTEAEREEVFEHIKTDESRRDHGSHLSVERARPPFQRINFFIPQSIFTQEELEELYRGDPQMVSCLYSPIDAPNQDLSSFSCDLWSKAEFPSHESIRKREVRRTQKMRKIELDFNLNV